MLKSFGVMELCVFRIVARVLQNGSSRFLISLPDFLDLFLFEKTILVANTEFEYVVFGQYARKLLGDMGRSNVFQ